MRTKLVRILCVLAATLAAVSGHGESGFRRSLSVQGAVPEPYQELLVKDSCPGDDAAWVKRREEMIRYLLRLHAPDYKRLVDGKWASVPGDDAYLNLEAVMQRSHHIAKYLARCGGPDTIIGNLRKFVTAQDNADYKQSLDHQFGHQATDQVYLHQAEAALTLPCLLRSQDFLQAMSSPDTYYLALAMIDEHNAGKAGHGCEVDGTQWTPLPFRSRFISTPDDAHTFGRLLVVVPGDDYDRWIQFGIWTPEDLDSGKKLSVIRNVSVVAMARHPDQAAGAHFDAIADFFRCENEACGETGKSAAPPPCAAASAGIQLCSRLAVTGETDNCERCHKMMPNSIHPEHVYDVGADRKLHALDDQAAAAAAERINARIVSLYARLPLYEVPQPGSDDVATWGRYGAIGMGADPTTFGQDDRSPAYIKACAAKAKVTLTDQSATHVGDAMNCSECHGVHKKAASLGVLNYPLATEKRRAGPILDKSGEVHLPNVIESHILRGVMPLSMAGGQITEIPLDLTDDERKALYACLSDEYLHSSQDHLASPSGLFVDWLRNQGGKGEPPPSTFAVKLPAAPAGKAASKHNLLVAPAVLVLGNGEQDFAQHCARCHSAVPGKTGKGPNLFGVFGRRMGADAQFAQSGLYSDAITAMAANPQLTWDEPSLMTFIADPDAFVNAKSGRQDGSTMEPSFPDAAMRQRLVDYLKTVK